jgi:hypothetical protein
MYVCMSVCLPPDITPCSRTLEKLIVTQYIELENSYTLPLNFERYFTNIKHTDLHILPCTGERWPWYLTFTSTVVTICTTRLMVKRISVFHTHSVYTYVFRIILTINSDCFPTSINQLVFVTETCFL